MTDTAPAVRIAEDAEGRIADAQGRNCPGCGRPLALAGAVLTLAVPDDAPAVPVLMHEDCLREGRRWPRFADLADALGADRQAAADALAGAVRLAREGIEAAAQALAAAAVEKAQALAAAAVEKARREAAAAVAQTAAARTDCEDAKREAAKASKALSNAQQALAERTKERDAWRGYAERVEAPAVECLVTADELGFGLYRAPDFETLKALAAALDPNRTDPMIDKSRKAKGLQPRQARQARRR